MQTSQVRTTELVQMLRWFSLDSDIFWISSSDIFWEAKDLQPSAVEDRRTAHNNVTVVSLVCVRGRWSVNHRGCGVCCHQWRVIGARLPPGRQQVDVLDEARGSRWMCWTWQPPIWFHSLRPSQCRVTDCCFSSSVNHVRQMTLVTALLLVVFPHAVWNLIKWMWNATNQSLTPGHSL